LTGGDDRSMLATLRAGSSHKVLTMPNPDDGSERKPKRVLVVEDDEGLCFWLGTILRQAGYEVEVALHFEPALQALERQSVDLLIADIVVPGGLNGIALSRMARLKSQGIKVLYITAHDIPGLSELALGKVLKKPLAGDELLDEVRRLLSRDATADAPDAS